MSTPVSQSRINFGLSQRAAHNSVQVSPWDAVERLMANLWAADKPDGFYGVGPRASPRLKKALVPFFNSEFRPSEPVLQKELLVLPGVATVIDALTWAICNEGEGIITPAPFYTGFKPMSALRAGGVLIPAPFKSIDGYRGLDDVFDPDMNRKALEKTLLQASQDGIIVRAVLISKYDF
ncbi:hypothetical protein J1614_008504 [Plenodomus biglobosus]|nr:hypothetical protein J1614_008504 [Plenodomus biglobosus]